VAIAKKNSQIAKITIHSTFAPLRYAKVAQVKGSREWPGKLRTSLRGHLTQSARFTAMRSAARAISKIKKNWKEEFN